MIALMNNSFIDSKVEIILLGDKNATSLCSKNISTLNSVL